MKKPKDLRPLVALLVSLALLGLTACGGSDDPGDAAGGRAEAVSAERRPGSLDWEQCGPNYQCAGLDVPRDHDDPDGPTTRLAILRQPAANQEERIGSLFVNPGGPGGSAVEYVARTASRLPAPIRERFDIVGFDPRGVGESEALECSDRVGDLYAADPTIEDDADRQALIDASQAFVDDCEQRHGPQLAQVGTEAVARDMDLVREAVGEEQVTYVGLSYGTAIGQVYASLFPERVRAMILDGVVAIDRPGPELAAAQGRGFEAALDGFAEDCAADPGCPVGADPLAAVDRVLAAAEAGPIPAPGADRPAGPGEATFGMIAALYSETNWDDLAQVLAGADQGDGSGLVNLTDQYLMRDEQGGYPTFDSYFAVSCLDATWPEGPEQLFAAGEAAGAESPHFGEAIVNDYVRCPLWPAEPQPLPAVDGEGVPPVLVISSTGDPATPYQAGVDLADTLPDAALLTREAFSHTAFSSGDRCVDDITTRYLVGLETPPGDARC